MTHSPSEYAGLINHELSVVGMRNNTKACEHAYSLNVLEWVTLLSKATAITFKLLLKAGKSLSGHRQDGLSFHQRIGYEGMRDYQSGLDAVQTQNLLTPTAKRCEQFAKKYKIKLTKIELRDGAVAHRLGPPNASKVVVQFHGGGYMSQALPEHISLPFGFAKNPRKDIAVVILEYSLASEHANHYPCQLQQAVSLIDHLLRTEKVSPLAITLIGDSAGGHLLLSLILHLSHPNPLVSPLKIDGRFSGALIISPWATLETSAESYQTNKQNDFLSAAALAYWAQNFLGGANPDPWNTPLMVPPEWWSDVPVDDILVLYGDHEVFRDDIDSLGEILKANHPRTTLAKMANEVHTHMIINRFLGVNAPCESEQVFIKWLDDQLEH